MANNLLNKYQAIEEIKTRFLKKAEGLSDAQLNKIPADGGWSAAQVLYHCGMAENETINTIQKNVQAQKVKLNRNFKSILNNILLVVFLKLPLKFKAPKVVSSVPEKCSFADLKNSYENSTTNFKKLLQELPAELEHKLIFKHPISGLFTMGQTINFLAEHYRHHERQLDKLL